MPDAGYHFVSWSDGVLTAARTDLNVTADISVTATFAINTYTLTYVTGANGTLTGTSPQTVNYGGNGTQVTAVPNAGYHFVSWSDGVLTAARTDLNVTADISVTATFAINTYTLTYVAGANGAISGTTPQTVNHGGNGTQVTAVPNAGYHFVSWSDGVLTAARTDLNVTADITVTASFASDQPTVVTIWPSTTVPGQVDGGPDSAVELGVKFLSDVTGTITGIRFYKAGANTGAHTGNLWTITGTLLAKVTFSNETASGWQQALFDTPVVIASNTIYVASYHANNGHYSADVNYFLGKGVDNPPLHALTNGVSGPNGIYAYGSSSVFPDQTWYAANYWVDVVFQAGPPPTLMSIAVTPANSNILIGATQQFTATGTYSDGSTQDITSQAIWTSSIAGVATINAAGLATGVSAGNTNTTISATLTGVVGSTTLTVKPVPLVITTTSLPNGISNVAYSAILMASGGTAPYVWSVADGSLPPGITLSSGGIISGTPTATGIFSFTGRVSDAGSPVQITNKALSITIVTVSAMTITTTSLPTGVMRMAYTGTLTAANGTLPYTWSLAGGTLPAGLTLNAVSGIITGRPTVSGIFSFTAQVSDAGSPVQTATKPLSISVVMSIWSNTTVPGLVDGGPDNAVELGVKFKSDVAGTITGIRFYKAGANTGAHTGNLWSITGTLLATATFSSETASGWQQALFATPVAITPNTIYVASYHANNGHYSCDVNYFQGKAANNPPLHALTNGVSGGNGVYAYGASSAFPTQTWNAANYWVDVVFQAGPPPTLMSIAVMPANPSILRGATQQFTATGTYSDGSTQNLTSQATWTSSITGVATINVAGLAAGISAGATTISATLAGVVGFTTLTVQPAPLVITTTSLPNGIGNAAYSAILTASGGTAPYAWSVADGSLPPGITLSSGGIISGTPTATGIFSFTGRVSDAGSPVQITNKALSITITTVSTVTITTTSLPTGVVNVAYTGTLMAANGTSPYSWSLASGSLPSGLTLNAVSGVITGRPTVSGIFSFTAQVSDAGSPVQTATKSLSISVVMSIWSNTTVPGLVDGGPDNAVELGVKFKSDVAGTITGIRFYKAGVNTGAHTGNLWSITGTLLATATFSSETATGWQQALFDTPVTIASNTVYVASYHANNGHYSADVNYFQGKAANNSPLHALTNGVSGGNGVYAYGTSSAFPTQTWYAANYWVDVMFQATVPPPPPPTLSSITLMAADTSTREAAASATGGNVEWWPWVWTSGDLSEEWGASNLIDGNTDTMWIGNDGGEPWRVILDLGVTTDVTGIQVMFQDTAWTNMGIIGSRDSEIWFDYMMATNEWVALRYLYVNFWGDKHGVKPPAIREIFWRDR